MAYEISPAPRCPQPLPSCRRLASLFRLCEFHAGRLLLGDANESANILRDRAAPPLATRPRPAISSPLRRLGGSCAPRRFRLLARLSRPHRPTALAASASYAVARDLGHFRRLALRSSTRHLACCRARENDRPDSETGSIAAAFGSGSSVGGGLRLACCRERLPSDGRDGVERFRGHESRRPRCRHSAPPLSSGKRTRAGHATGSRT